MKREVKLDFFIEIALKIDIFGYVRRIVRIPFQQLKWRKSEASTAELVHLENLESHNTQSIAQFIFQCTNHHLSSSSSHPRFCKWIETN